MLLTAALSKFFPFQVRDRGSQIHHLGIVRIHSGDSYLVSASVKGTKSYNVQLRRESNDLLVSCECPYFDTEGACKHVWAVLLEADTRRWLLGNRATAPMRLIEVSEVPLEEFLPNGFGPRQPRAAWERILDEVRYIDLPQPREREWPADREVIYVIDCGQTFSGSTGLHVEILHRDRKKDGTFGKLKGTNIPRASLAHIPDPLDREILTIIGGVPDVYYDVSQSIRYVCRLSGTIVDVVVPKMCATGRFHLRLNPGDAVEQQQPLRWDEGPPWKFRLAIQQEAKSWIIRGRLERNGESIDLRLPAMLSVEGLLFLQGTVARFDDAGAFAWIRLLRRDGKIDVPMAQSAAFAAKLLEHGDVPPADWPQDLRIREETATPKPRFTIERHEPAHAWDKNLFYGKLEFDYNGAILQPEAEDRGVLDRDKMVFFRRSRDAEQAAVDVLTQAGAKPTIWRGSEAWEFAPPRLPRLLRALASAGWHVEAQGKAFRQSTGFRAEITSGIDWFELHAQVEFGEASARLPELLKAIRKGESTVVLTDGSVGIIPDDLLERYGTFIGMGRPEGDHVRYSRAQTGLLDALLEARGDITFDAAFAQARTELRTFERIESAPQPAGFVGELRDYQREGLAWMQFLQRVGFGGCLADDMGVGKTPQVLALLETRRELRAAGGKIEPSLVVVPRSLVYNWKLEAARFTPRLKVLDHSGTLRSKNLAGFQNYDVILTTYGTLRRDAVDFQSVRFDYVILDEAQAIKNADSESAKAARLLNADHRLAMSGTPIENHLGELWSLFEFLNPGMLGAFSAARGMRNPDEETRNLLAKVVRPFILRRTKDQVARELPPKLEQTIYCELESPQRKQYNELRDHYRRAVLGRIEADGIGKSKMHILEALLRLRQAACHPGLLDSKRKGDSSAKLDVLMMQLREVIDEGHKALVFSQFTSLLSIVREKLDGYDVNYEYLDGRTRDRQAHVERFQNDPECKLFLISLKAGGVGLNLTAAEYVFLLDPWWNPAVEAQAIDRTHRIGQANHVFAYRLIARDTVEEKVLELQAHKRGLADSIIRADSNLVRNLKREDLEFLFS